MGDLTENTTPSAEPRAKVFTLSLASRMLPLVKRVVEDYLTARNSVNRLSAEKDRLDRNKRELNWEQRCRRYEVTEDLARWEENLLDAQAELELLGLDILDEGEGRVGFPTIVNDRRAYFSWKPDEVVLRHWQFAADMKLRQIPSTWGEPVTALR